MAWTQTLPMAAENGVTSIPNGSGLHVNSAKKTNIGPHEDSCVVGCDNQDIRQR